MLYGLWDDANDVLAASSEEVGMLLLIVRTQLEANGDHAADSLVLVMEDDDEGLHFIASDAELARMARAAALPGDEA